MLKQLNKILELKQYDEFLSSLPKIISKLTKEERQGLLIIILDYHYEDRLFSKFKKIFDLIIGSKLNLNFNIDHWAPTFLCLVIHKASSIQLINYFIAKGASLNFVATTFSSEQYQTCLDFTQMKLNDLLSHDYNFSVPKKKEQILNGSAEFIISKDEYLYLYEQSEYLSTLINTDKVFDHIKSLGGKTYIELKTIDCYIKK